MYKIKFGILCILTVLCSLKIFRLNELEDQKQSLVNFQESVKKFDQKMELFQCQKSKEKLFSKDTDLKKIIEAIYKKLKMKKVLVKCNTINEVKILADREKKIYKFIDDLFLELPGIVKFESIKISKNKNNDIAAIIQFKISYLPECQNIIDITPHTKTYNIKNMFEMKRPHRLLCIIRGAKAYIDNSWFSVGDQIDDYKITDIDQNFLELQDDNACRRVIELGENW